MQKISLNEYVDRAHDWNDELVDAVSPTSEMKFTAGEEAQTLSFAQVDNKEDLATMLFNGAYTEGRGKMTDGAFEQMCSRLSIPPQWALDNEKCPPELRQHISNWKLERKDATWLVRQRERGETVRGILSDQYQPYNHLQLVKAVASALEIEGVEVEVLLKQFSDDMRAYLIMPSINFDAPNGNGRGGSADGGGTGGITPAVYLGNSEIGRGKVRVNPGGFRSYCTNGMVFGWQSRGQDTFALIHRWHTEAEMAVLVNEAIVRALSMSEEGALKFIETQHVTLNPQRVGDLVEQWAGKYGIMVASKEKLNAMVEVRTSDTGRYTLFDFINDTTQVARDLDDPKQTESMEVMAGNLVYQGVASRYVEGG